MDFAEIAKQAGCRPEAAEDIVRRCEAKFQGEEPTPEAVQAWLAQTLRSAAPHLWPEAQTPWGRLHMTQSDFDAMPATWKLEQGRLQQPQVTTPHPRRPVYRNLTPAELDSLKDLPFHERTTRGRQLQQTPLPTQG